MLIAVVMARSLSVVGFGAFGLAFAVYQFSLGCLRASIGEPLLIRGAPSTTRSVGAGVFELGVFASLLVGCACAIAGLIIGTDVGEALMALAIGVPGLVAQDQLRYVSYAASNARRAFSLDASMLILQISTILLVLDLNGRTVFWLTLAWAAPATVCAVIGYAKWWGREKIGSGVGWLRSNIDLAPRYLGEYLTIAGVQQGLIFVVGVVVSVAAVGSLRATQVLLGPLNIISMSAALLVLPMAAEIARTDLQRLFRFTATVAVVLAGITLTYTCLVLVLPSSFGEALLGQSWDSGRPILLTYALTILLGNLSYGATVGLRATMQSKLSFRLRIATAPVCLVAVALGAIFGGLQGAVVALAIATFVQALSWWTLYRTRFRKLAAERT